MKSAASSPLYKIVKLLLNDEFSHQEIYEYINLGIEYKKNRHQRISPIRGLSLVVQNGLSRRNLTAIRKVSDQSDKRFLPASNKVDTARKDLLKFKEKPFVDQITYSQQSIFSVVFFVLS